jgi:uncharacterized protein (DUF885 family)
MRRGCRLVVDTGIRAKGWTREQAMEFLASNTALSLHSEGIVAEKPCSASR